MSKRVFEWPKKTDFLVERGYTNTYTKNPIIPKFFFPITWKKKKEENDNIKVEYEKCGFIWIEIDLINIF